MEPLLSQARTLTQSGHQFDLIVVGLGISGLWLSYLASSQNLRVLGLDKNTHSCSPTTASHGFTRRFHPTQGTDLDSALSMWDDLERKYIALKYPSNNKEEGIESLKDEGELIQD